MAETTGISWTDATWSPVTGCSKVGLASKLRLAPKVGDLPQKSGEGDDDATNRG